MAMFYISLVLTFYSLFLLLPYYFFFLVSTDMADLVIRKQKWNLYTIGFKLKLFLFQKNLTTVMLLVSLELIKNLFVIGIGIKQS